MVNYKITKRQLLQEQNNDIGGGNMKDVEIRSVGNNKYIVDTIGYKCEGYYKRLQNKTTEVKLEKWFDKNTKRYKTSKNKLYNHTQRWFAYMVEKYYFLEV